MNQKKIKKQRKEIRRAVSKKIGDGLGALSNIVRSRPRFVPKWIWIILYLPLFKVKYIKMIYRSID